MTQQHWYPFKYRDFYDFPRFVVVNALGRILLLDCEFDNEAEDFRERFEVYELPASAYLTIDGMADWRGLSADGTKLGSIPVDAVEFDATKRTTLRSQILELLLRADPT